MKRLIFISILFIGLFTLATYEVIVVNQIITKLEVLTMELQSDIVENKEDVKSVLTNVENVKQFWNSKEHSLCLMFNHKDLSTITDTLSRLNSYVENDDYDNAIAEVNLLKEYSEKNKHIMGFNMQNLL